MSAFFSTFTIEFMSMTSQNRMPESYLPESMKLYEKWFLLIVFVLFVTQTAFCQEECELRKENGDLKVYTCLSDTKLKKIKTELVVENTSFEELVKFVNDIDNYVNWQYNTLEAKVLRVNAGSIIYRTVLDAPWPVSNREVITELTSAFDSVKQELIISSHNVEYDYPLDDELVRVPSSDARWQVTSVKGSLKIEYTLNIDPGGVVPSWLVNIAMAEGPYNSFMKLKALLQQKP